MLVIALARAVTPNRTLAGMETLAALTSKQQNEQRAFVQFAERLGSRHEWLSVESRPEPEPDLLCTHNTDGPVAFEVVSLTDPLIAELQAAGANAYEGAFPTSDPSERIIRRKLHRSYETTASRIELLVYTDGQLVTPDDVIVATILPWFDAIDHQFQRIWFMGELETRCLWNAS